MTATDDSRLEQVLEAVLEGDPQRSTLALEELKADSPGGVIPKYLVEKAVNTAALLLAVGQSEQACAILESLLGACADEPALLNNLAFAHLVGGRADRAVALWERAAKLAPDDGLIANNLARARSS